MPFGDGTGPLGDGPKTGRGLGRCGNVNKNKNLSNGRDRRSRRNGILRMLKDLFQELLDEKEKEESEEEEQ